jgi:hypothetical protein
MNPVLRKFDYSKELPLQRELFEECFPENKGSETVTENYYKWKFQGYPGDNHSYEYCCTEEDDLIGYYAAIPYDYYYLGEHIKVAMVCDVMTGFKARGKGIFTKLGTYSTQQFKNEGLAFSTGYPIRSEVIPGHKKAKWSFPFIIPMYGKFISLKSFLSNKNLGILYWILNPLLLLLNLLSQSFTIFPENLKTERFHSKDLDSLIGLDVFFNEWQKEIPIVLNKSIKFLKWRLGAPGKNYHISVLKDQTKIVGYSISRNVTKEDVLCLGILDLCLLKGYEKYAGILFSENEQICKEENCELILFMLSKPWAKKYHLIRNLYFATPFKFSFILKKYNEKLSDEKLFNEKNWHLTWLDSDDL